MQYRAVLVAATTVAVVLSIVVAGAASAGPTRSAATTFDSIDVDGLATIGGNLRVDGRVYRGAAGPRSDGKPFIVNDHAQVEGDLSIKGKLKSTGTTLVLKDNAKITGNLALLGSLSDPEGTLTLADNTRVNGNLTVTGALDPGSITGLSSMVTSAGFAQASTVSDLSDTVDAVWSWTYATYQYNRCVLNLDQLETNPTIASMLYCWDLWVGTNLDGSMTAGDPSASTLLPVAVQGSAEYDAQVRAEMDRAAQAR